MDTKGKILFVLLLIVVPALIGGAIGWGLAQMVKASKVRSEIKHDQPRDHSNGYSSNTTSFQPIE